MKKILIIPFIFCLSFGLNYGTSLADDFSMESRQFLEKAVEDILDEASSSEEPSPPEYTDADRYRMDLAPKDDHFELPLGASHHPGGKEAVAVDGEPRRIKKYMKKPLPQNVGNATSDQQRGNTPDDWRKVSFSTGSFTPESGVDNEMAVKVPVLSVKGREFVYGFILMDEYLTDETRKELEALGVEVLGPHSQLYKAKFPTDLSTIQRVVDLPYVEWLGYSLMEQKIDLDLQKVISGQVAFETPGELPVIINLFDDDPDGFFKGLIEDMGVTVGKYDPELRSYRAVVSLGVMNDIVALDFVLFVEMVRQYTTSHNESMPTMGVDYIRPGGPWTSYDGSSTVLGIMDTGFMMGSATPIMHQDLNKYGCGINFNDDGTSVWNDEDGHGTHVLATICGTGTANDDFRGAAIGVGNSIPIRAAKVANSTGGVSGYWVLEAMDWFDDSSACGGSSPRPQVINASVGASGYGLTGTDAASRKLDQKVWTYDQLYVVAAGNEGPDASTIGIPAVAKNALAVGNVSDRGYNEVGYISNQSSRGPTGDGRMKPNLVAVGTWVTSALAGTTNEYFGTGGTSMAAPHVSGIAATLMQHYADFRWRPYLVRSHLMAASILHDDETTPVNNNFGGRNTYGLGRVDAYLAHWSRSNYYGWTSYWSWGTVDNDTYIYDDITVPSGIERLVVVMTWDEEAASSGASHAVTYDLDLYVDKDADCSDTNGQCGEWASKSYDDNVEYLIINYPPSGTYRLKATPWNAPSTGLPVGISAFIIRGDPTPSMSLVATPSTSTLVVGSTFTVTTTVSNPSYIASGVQLTTDISSGLSQTSVQTTREDSIINNFGTDEYFTLGNIIQGDSRSATWTFKATSAGTQNISFRAWSENGGTVNRTVSVTAGSPPETPANIMYPSSSSNGNVAVYWWPEVSDATSYTLQRATNSSFSDPTTVYSGSSTSYNQTGLGNGTYYYRVRANNTYGSSDWRIGDAITVCIMLSTPASITYLSSSGDSSFTVSWSSVSDATSYTLQRATNSTFFRAITVYSGSSTSYNQTGLDTGTYYYRVRANNSCDSSDWKNGGPIVVSLGSAPPPPASISYPSSDNDGDFTVSWSASSGATNYTLQRATNASFFRAVVVYSGSSTSYNQTGLGDGTYYYRVDASNEYGSSGWTNGSAIVVSLYLTCEGDFNGDSDVDGLDLAVLAADPGLLDLSIFAAEFGRIDCQ